MTKYQLLLLLTEKQNPTMKVEKRGRIYTKSFDKSIGDLMDSQIYFVQTNTNQLYHGQK